MNVTEIGYQEWRDVIFLRYVIEPPYLACHCDGCGVSFSIVHPLNYKKYGLVTSFHNKLRGGVSDLARISIKPTHVRDDSLINPGRVVRSGKAFQTKSNPPKDPPGTVVDSEQKGNLLIRDFYDRGTDCILYM